MRRRAQPHNLWPQSDQAVIGVMRNVGQGGVNGHGGREKRMALV